MVESVVTNQGRYQRGISALCDITKGLIIFHPVALKHNFLFSPLDKKHVWQNSQAASVISWNTHTSFRRNFPNFMQMDINEVCRAH